MRNVGTLLVAVLGVFLFTAGSANAQGFSYSQRSVTIGGNGFGLHISEGTFSGSVFDLQIYNGHRGPNVGIHIRKGQRWHGPVYHHQQRRIYRQPRHVQPQAISVTVYETRQVMQEIVYYDAHGRLCRTGEYELVLAEVAVRKTAHWSHRHQAYVYYDSHGRLCIYRGGRVIGYAD